MGVKTETFFDDAARRRNRLIYLLCGVVTVACIVTLLILSAGDDRKSPKSGQDPVADAPKEPDRPTERPEPSDGPETAISRPELVATGPLQEGQKKYEEALDLLRKARDLGPGSKEATEIKHRALAALADAKAVYEKWLDAHPEDEERYGGKIAEIQRQIFWTRRNMSASDFPDTSGEGEETAGGDGPGSDGPGDADSNPVDVPTPRPTPTRPEINPDQATKQFLALATRAFRDGRPWSVVENGRRLMEDERLSAHHEAITRITGSASDMVEFLAAAQEALAKFSDRQVRLGLRNGEATGVLVSALAGKDIVLRVGDGDVSYSVADLSGEQLIDLANEAGHLTNGYAHAAAGSYLYQRGDRSEALEQLVRARAEGVDLGQYEMVVQGAIKRSRPLQALTAWLALEPRLGEESEEVLGLITAFRSSHFDSSYFRTHREKIFRAVATAAEANPFDMKNLWFSGAKPSSRGKIKLEYSFEDAEELTDFGQNGKNWVVGTGALYGEKDTIWIEKFDLTNADVTISIPGPGTLVLGLWSRDRSGRAGVNLRIYPKDGEFVFDLRHGDRSFGRETIPVPKGAMTITLQRREDKYQVKLNKKTLFRATDNTRNAEEALHTVGISARNGPVTIEGLEIASTVDMNWARAGGSRFDTWIKGWYVSGPYAIPPKTLKAGLVKEQWPETLEFDPKALGADGKPGWRPFVSPNPWIDLKRLRPNENAVAYHAVRVWSPDRRSAILEIICDDAARAWLNGDVVIKSAPLFEPQRVTVKLRPGDNLLMVKVLQGGGYWGSATRFLTKNGEPMRELSYW